MVAGRKHHPDDRKSPVRAYTHYPWGITPRMNLPGPDIPIKPQPFVDDIPIETSVDVPHYNGRHHKKILTMMLFKRGINDNAPYMVHRYNI